MKIKSFLEILREATEVPEVKFIKGTEVVSRSPFGAIAFLERTSNISDYKANYSK
jgi:hypothetical protein